MWCRRVFIVALLLLVSPLPNGSCFLAAALESTSDAQQRAAHVNNDNDACGNLLVGLDEAQQQCDCYNFCNGKLIGCFAFGEKTSFSCSGELVAGCLEAQRQFGVSSMEHASSSWSSLPMLSVASIFLSVVMTTLCVVAMD